MRHLPRHTRFLSILSVGALSLLGAPDGRAQVPTALLREGDTLTIDGQNQTIHVLRDTASNACGGYACSVRTGGPLGMVDLTWGSFSGGAPGVLQVEATTADYIQVSHDSSFGISATEVAYGASSQEIASGQPGIDGAWLGNSPAAMTGTDAVGGKFWKTIENVGTTLDGRRYFRAGLSDVPLGPVTQRGLFVEDDFHNIVSVVLSGVTYPGMPAPLTAGAVQPSARFATLRGRWIAPVWLALTASNDSAMMIDGHALTLGGTIVHETETVPPSVGGIGDRWDNFNRCGVNEAGDWFFSGDMAGLPGTLDDFICRNDGIWLREGDDVGGETLTGSVRAAELNASNELAFVWGVLDGMGAAAQALFFEDTLIAREGDAVDLDGDGMLDPGATITEFIEGALSIGSSGDIYVVAQVSSAAGTQRALFHFPRELGERYCTAAANHGGGPGSISAFGVLSEAANDFTLRCASMPQQAFGFFLASKTQGFAAQPGGSAGNLCLGGEIGRFQLDIQHSGLAGAIELSIDLDAVPQPSGTVQVAAGETWNFSTWFRDVEPMGAPTSNFSDAISVTFQ